MALSELFSISFAIFICLIHPLQHWMETKGPAADLGEI